MTSEAGGRDGSGAPVARRGSRVADGALRAALRGGGFARSSVDDEGGRRRRRRVGSRRRWSRRALRGVQSPESCARHPGIVPRLQRRPVFLRPAKRCASARVALLAHPAELESPAPACETPLLMGAAMHALAAPCHHVALGAPLRRAEHCSRALNDHWHQQMPSAMVVMMLPVALATGVPELAGSPRGMPPLNIAGATRRRQQGAERYRRDVAPLAATRHFMTCELGRG